MSEMCQWLHEQLELLPFIKYDFELNLLPRKGIYFFYETGEICKHEKINSRIVRIGTHKSNNFRNRISEHYLLNERKMNFDQSKPKPSDRSIFRKHIGRTILNRASDEYLGIWNIDFIKRHHRVEDGQKRDIEKEKSIESNITEIIRRSFFFRYIIIENQSDRIGEKGLEKKLIATVAKCRTCEPSNEWLGNYHPSHLINNSGLWLIQNLGGDIINNEDKIRVSQSISDTLGWIRNC